MYVGLSKPEEHSCKICGIRFLTYSKYRSTCSRECQKTAHEERTRNPKKKRGPRVNTNHCDEVMCIHYSDEQRNGCDILSKAYRENCPFFDMRWR